MKKKKRFHNWLTEIEEHHELLSVCRTEDKIEYPYNKIYIVENIRTLIKKFPKEKREFLSNKFVYPYL